MMEGRSKMVLVSYLDRNKVFKIPRSEVQDNLAFLEKQFKAEFKFDSNVHLEVTFEKFDQELGCHVEVKKDYVLHDKEKLKAVVTSRLATSPTLTGQVSYIVGFI